MARRSDESKIFRFQDFVLNPESGTLTRAGDVVPLRPKSFELLSYLARHSGRVVPKSELMSAVWRDTIVTDDSLTQCIADIRRAFGASARDTVRTVARRGYSFAGAPAVEGPVVPCVAVLPFEVDGALPANEPFVDGLVNEITHGLGCFRTVTVLAHSSAFAFRPDTRPDCRTVGERLGADYLVEGAVRRSSGRLLVSVCLVDAKRGTQVGIDSVESADSDLFEVQATIVRRIVGRLVARLDAASLQRAWRKPTDSLEAHEALLRGVSMLRGYAAGCNEEACQLFGRACALDPSYGLAHAYLALGQLVMHGYGFAPAEVLEGAWALAEKGVLLAPEEPRCHRILGHTRLYRREHEAAEHHFLRSLELNPYDADTVAQMGFLLALRGRPGEALTWMERARRLNPLYPDWYHYDRAVPLYASGDYRGAATELELIPRLGPFGLARLAACHAQLGAVDTAARLIAEAMKSSPGFSPIEYARGGIAFEHPADLEHLTEGLSKALTALKSRNGGS